MLGLLGMLGARPGRMLVVGCEPASVAAGIGLSEPVAAAVDEAVRMVLELVREAPGPAPPGGKPVTAAGSPRRSDHMCLGIPGEIVEFLPDQPDLARVDVSGVRRVINIGLLADEPPEPGDWVLIHVGFALSKIDEDEAAAALDFLEGIGQAYADELAALAESRIE